MVFCRNGVDIFSGRSVGTNGRLRAIGGNGAGRANGCRNVNANGRLRAAWHSGREIGVHVIVWNAGVFARGFAGNRCHSPCAYVHNCQRRYCLGRKPGTGKWGTDCGAGSYLRGKGGIGNPWEGFYPWRRKGSAGKQECKNYGRIKCPFDGEKHYHGRGVCRIPLFHNKRVGRNRYAG